MNETSNIYKKLSDCELGKIIEKYYGKQTDFNARLISGGLFNTTYYVEISECKEKIILRVGPVNRKLLLNFEHNLMKAEEYVYKLCNDYKIPCSQVLLCDTKKKIIDRDYMIVKYIDGKPLSELNLNEEQQDKICNEVGNYMREFHNITSTKFGRVYDVLKGNGFESWTQYLIDEVANLKEKLLKYNLISVEEVELLDKVMDKYTGLLDEIETPHLIHGDLWSGNILVKLEKEEYRLATVIDADRSIFGDVDFDLCNPWFINQSFVKGYGKTISNSIENKTRRKIYRIIVALMESYSWKVQYNNSECQLQNKTEAIELIKELLN